MKELKTIINILSLNHILKSRELQLFPAHNK
jgi:hypothetical protein